MLGSTQFSSWMLLLLRIVILSWMWLLITRMAHKLATSGQIFLRTNRGLILLRWWIIKLRLWRIVILWRVLRLLERWISGHLRILALIKGCLALISGILIILSILVILIGRGCRLIQVLRLLEILLLLIRRCRNRVLRNFIYLLGCSRRSFDNNWDIVHCSTEATNIASNRIICNCFFAGSTNKQSMLWHFRLFCFITHLRTIKALE